MAATVSFVIPMLNEQQRIAGLLQGLREHYPESERIVVDGGSSDHSVATAMPLCSQLLVGERGRAAQMNLGGRVASADYICFLHVDSWPGVSASQLSGYLDAAPQWGFCRIRLSGRQRVFRLIEWFMNTRSLMTSIATGDQMLFMKRDLFDNSGGFDDIPLMEDVACCKRLRRLAKPLVIAEAVQTSSRRWEEHGVARTVLTMWCLRLAYFFGVSPWRLWRYYYGR